MIKKIILRRLGKKSLKTDCFLAFESDDWGSIRVPNYDTFFELYKSEDVKSNYLMFDKLESREDVESLSSLLEGFSDNEGNHPVFVMDFATFNVDFDLTNINKELVFEKFYDTYTKYYGGDNGIIDEIKKGIDNKVFLPQLHCAEHLDSIRWWNDYNKGLNEVRKPFNLRMYNTSISFSKRNPYAYMASFNSLNKNNSLLFEEKIDSAIDTFYEAFGYYPTSFVASCYVWNNYLEKIMIRKKIFHFQTSYTQFVPNGERYFRKFHYTGEKSKFGIKYTVRNCFFEPSEDLNALENCIRQIDYCFNHGIPAIVCSHRVNYMSGISKENADKNIRLLGVLLKKIQEKWPNVRFGTSIDLIEEE